VKRTECPARGEASEERRPFRVVPVVGHLALAHGRPPDGLGREIEERQEAEGKEVLEPLWAVAVGKERRLEDARREREGHHREEDERADGEDEVEDDWQRRMVSIAKLSGRLAPAARLTVDRIQDAPVEVLVARAHWPAAGGVRMSVSLAILRTEPASRRTR
jgi:hypothetical protein